MTRFPAALALPLLLTAQVGKDWGVERNSYRDPVTGAEIANLTAQDRGKAQNLYYHVSNFTADNSNVILAAERGGGWHILRSELATGRLIQITGEPGVGAASCLPHPKEPRRLFYLIGPDVFEIDIISLVKRKIGTIPEPRTGGYQQPSLSHDGKWLTVAKQRDAANWEIGMMDLETGRYRTVLAQGFRIGHTQHSPVDPRIFYVWETGGYAPQRSWIVNSDGSANRPLYYRADPKSWFTQLKEWMTHEAWVHETGEMTMIMDKVGIVAVNREGESRMLVHGNYWHAAARPDGKFLVADDFSGRIWTIESATGNTRLVATGTRAADRSVHAHASFDRTGRYVLFNNANRYPTVSIVDLESLPPARIR